MDRLWLRPVPQCNRVQWVPNVPSLHPVRQHVWVRLPQRVHVRSGGRRPEHHVLVSLQGAVVPSCLVCLVPSVYPGEIKLLCVWWVVVMHAAPPAWSGPAPGPHPQERHHHRGQPDDWIHPSGGGAARGYRPCAAHPMEQRRRRRRDSVRLSSLHSLTTRNHTRLTFAGVPSLHVPPPPPPWLVCFAGTACSVSTTGWRPQVGKP